MNEKNKIMVPKTLPGFMELMPNEQILFNSMMDKIRNSYEKFGFLPLDTPIIEMSEVLLAKAGGETEKQIYRFTKGENDLSLRFDLTVPLAKFVAMNERNLQFPFRRYQLGKVYRGEKPQRGRFREFYQCDIDIIEDGELSIINDAEIPAIIYATFKELNIGDFTISINNRKILNGLFEDLGLENVSKDVLRIVDKIGKIGEAKVLVELEEIGVGKTECKSILDFINIKGTTDQIISSLKAFEIKSELYRKGVEELEEVVKYMRSFNVPDINFVINLTIARGLDYYTGTVYETFLNDYKKIGSICSGGRYDNLAEFYTDKKLPGVGICIGLTRLFYQLNELNLIKDVDTTIAKVLVISMNEDMSKSIEVANELRKENINTELYLGTRKIKAKFKYADKLKTPFVIVIGEDEIKSNTVTLKDMISGEQETLSLGEAIEKIQK